MKEQAQQLLGTPVLAGSFVLGRGMSVRKGIGAASAALGVRTGTTADVELGAVGYLAVTADEIAIFAGKQGLLKPKITGLVARLPRGSLRELRLERATMLVSGTISFDDGRGWSFEVPRARAAQIDAVAALLDGGAVTR